MKRTLTLGTAALLLATGLSGCGKDESEGDGGPTSNGIADMKPVDALAEAAKVMGAYADITYTGFMTGGTDDRLQATATHVLGEACELRLRGEKFGVMTLRGVERTQYLNRDIENAMLIEELDRIAAQLWDDEWVSYQMDGDERDECYGEDLVPDGADRRSFKAGATRDVEGRQARLFVGKDADGEKLTLWIATTGSADVLRVQGKDSDGPWQFTLTETDSGVEITPPPKKDVIASDKL